jgi:hypothetical protein
MRHVAVTSYPTPVITSQIDLVAVKVMSRELMTLHVLVLRGPVPSAEACACKATTIALQPYAGRAMHASMPHSMPL